VTPHIQTYTQLVELAMTVTIDGPVLLAGNLTRVAAGLYYVTYRLPTWLPEGNYSLVVLTDCQLVAYDRYVGVCEL
jgi:hypothetical protein